MNRKQLGESEQIREVEALRKDVEALNGVVSAYLFGSAVKGGLSSFSDLDVLLVFSDKETLKTSRKTYYKNQSKGALPRDIIWMDELSFDSQKDLGGIAYVAYSEGYDILKATDERD